jgi:hypothetical protein
MKQGEDDRSRRRRRKQKGRGRRRIREKKRIPTDGAEEKQGKKEKIEENQEAAEKRKLDCSREQ